MSKSALVMCLLEPLLLPLHGQKAACTSALDFKIKSHYKLTFHLLFFVGAVGLASYWNKEYALFTNGQHCKSSTCPLWKKLHPNRRLHVLSAVPAKSGPLDFPSENVFFYFLPMKRVQDTCFKSSLVVLQFSFFASPQVNNDFWPDHLCEQRSKMF